MSTRAREILLVDENPGDVRRGRYSNAVQPDLIVLDMNLPKKGGHEVLAEIKADEYLKKIPVAVFTGSTARDDIAKAYASHANCYVTKPSDLNQFLHAVHSIERLWLSMVEFPAL